MKTYAQGLITGILFTVVIFIVIAANYLVSKYSKSNIIYFAIFSVCLLIYKLPIILEFNISYWLLSYIFSVITNYIVFMFFKRITRTNV